ncbi:PIN domain-containing protein [Lyngbya sp. CCY1209]|uniref:type II toxin-antitoxin system VapC family toxin n=1 Tax=Lyngbya sp. CCY1209 TaxID=2886103 RepID=UPI002D2024B4|nr:PIN domain-containing protein [Lyngbya sp. CCY1209]MEB3883811.1 PIN domain-containing protein [Lyngbya sp. CCY1209]
MERLDAIADTGFVVALLNRGDRNHEAVVEVYRQMASIGLPQPALTEIAYLVGRDGGIGTAVKFLRSIETSRFCPIAMTSGDFDRVADILEMYQDSRIDFVDACVMAVAERFNREIILTLDRRDFSLFRPRPCAAFRLLPED